MALKRKFFCITLASALLASLFCFAGCGKDLPDFYEYYMKSTPEIRAEIIKSNPHPTPVTGGGELTVFAERQQFGTADEETNAVSIPYKVFASYSGDVAIKSLKLYAVVSCTMSGSPEEISIEIDGVPFMSQRALGARAEGRMPEDALLLETTGAASAEHEGTVTVAPFDCIDVLSIRFYAELELDLPSDTNVTVFSSNSGW